jgi:hypothetical protein
MRRATITLPDDLEAEVEEYRAEQVAPPSLTSLVQAALRRFLGERRSHGDDDTPYSRSGLWSGTGAEPSEIAEEPGVYEVGRAEGRGSPRSAPPWERSGPVGGRLEDLPALLASLPRLSEAEADELADDLDRAREELSRSELIDPWSRSAPDGRSDAGGA